MSSNCCLLLGHGLLRENTNLPGKQNYSPTFDKTLDTQGHKQRRAFLRYRQRRINNVARHRQPQNEPEKHTSLAFRQRLSVRGGVVEAQRGSLTLFPQRLQKRKHDVKNCLTGGLTMETTSQKMIEGTWPWKTTQFLHPETQHNTCTTTHKVTELDWGQIMLICSRVLVVFITDSWLPNELLGKKNSSDPSNCTKQWSTILSSRHCCETQTYTKPEFFYVGFQSSSAPVEQQKKKSKSLIGR